MCCWFDMHDEENGGDYMGQFVWELFSTVDRQGLAGRALWRMRQACGWKGAGVELQVHGRNPEAQKFYENLGGYRTAWWALGIEAGDHTPWRKPDKGQIMMRFEAADLDRKLDARKSWTEVQGEQVIIADSLEKLRNEGLLDGLLRAAGIATGHQQWRPRGELPCLRAAGDEGCRYVVIVRKQAGGASEGVQGAHGSQGGAGQLEVSRNYNVN
jgi:hypothetical protein